MRIVLLLTLLVGLSACDQRSGTSQYELGYEDGMNEVCDHVQRRYPQVNPSLQRDRFC